VVEVAKRKDLSTEKKSLHLMISSYGHRVLERYSKSLALSRSGIVELALREFEKNNPKVPSQGVK